MLEDPVVSEYVNRIGQTLVRNSDAKASFTIKVLRSAEVNAVAFPGGFVYVNSALIRTADNEAELAGALAHEIAHVAARHYTRQASREQIINFAMIPLVFIGGLPGIAIRESAELAKPLAFKKLSRNAEAEADMLGIQYLYKAGYDPTALVDFFEKISAQEKSKPGVFGRMLLSHPALGSRIRSIQKQIQARPESPAAVLDSDLGISACQGTVDRNRERQQVTLEIPESCHASEHGKPFGRAAGAETQ